MADPAEVRAAGAVLWRPGPGHVGAPRVALVHRPRYDDWSLPKGKGLPGEHVLVTAVREVAEETGVRVLLGRRLSTVRYTSGGVPKRVDYWAARPARDKEDALGEFVPGTEVDDLVWLPVTQAKSRLTYAHDATVLAGFANGPADTTPVILARHGVAAGKDVWRQAGHPDLTRPLTARGTAQARVLAGLLSCFGPVRVISSGAERCLATVRSYAGLTGATVETEPAFTVPQLSAAAEGPDADAVAEAARERVSEVIASGIPTVICAHRENLPSLLASACERLGAPVPAGPPLPKGGFWVLHASGGALAGVDRHDTEARGDADRDSAGAGEVGGAGT